MLFRKIEAQIEDHLKSDSRAIMLIDGARQVGKTYIIRHVGQKLFENYIELNLVEDYVGARLFANAKTVEDFYLAVSMLAGDRMKEKENTLIFIDEIQAYPHLLTLLNSRPRAIRSPFLPAVPCWVSLLHTPRLFPWEASAWFVCSRWTLKSFYMPMA